MKHILLVDDESEILDILQEILSPHFEVIHRATNAEEAMRIVKSEPLRMIILDFHMPEVQGDELARRIRAEGLQIPLVFLTGDASRELAMRSVRLGVSDILEKPFEPENVVEVINRVLEIEKRKKNLFEVEKSQDKAAIEKHKKVLGLLQAVNDKKRSS